MKGKLVTAARANNGGKQQNQTDLLVCFPSRAHLALMPKPICSPSRPAELPKRHPRPRATKRHPSSSSCSSHARFSPLFQTKTPRNTNTAREPEIDEPTSPKVTCAGQIKVRPSKPRSSSTHATSRPTPQTKNWISVVEEIERLRKDRKKKSGSWLEALGIKKDALQIFSSFHGLRFNMACFGSFPGSIDCTSDEDDDDEESVAREDEASSSQDVFSKWFMLIEQNQDVDFKEEIVQRDEEEEEEEDAEKDDMHNSAVPPPNALLLMRCRSAPAKGLLNTAEEVETEEVRIANKAIEEDTEKEKEKEKLVVMRCAPDFFKVSMDIAKETWIVGGEMDLLARSRSCKR
ncbi:nucleolar GTP-binding protein [Rhynchospora pubera]|uniref:Nucleolar GTP-binding protein n=1 Tax=Rhynchospora pubera TaxID=906938 RepID=A0AAV8HFP8_9POAL|nr:nucleolar GTP-binding protein [Rhynchospora pubera]